KLTQSHKFAVNSSWVNSYASSAVRKLLIYLAEYSTLKFVDAYALVGNVGSNKILSKAGFDLVERVESYTVFKEKDQDVHYYRKALTV
ncbi:MAG: GNAT family N-acetyltransferase, partial [Vibrio toranzoniae]